MHPNPAKAADGKRLRTLEPDPATAPIVKRIFAEYLTGSGLYAIAEGLTRDRVPSPSMQDRARNRHRTGAAWAKSAVRAILANPRYTGYQVWNRQRRVETLKDVGNVAAGYDSRMRWNEATDWVWSAEPTHEALISTDDFTEAARHLATGRNRPATRKPRRTPRPYLLRGLLHCGVCGRRMQGQVNHDELHYRCRYPSEYALANIVEHPRNVYVREARVVAPLDGWLAGLFDPRNLDDTCAQLAVAASPPDHDVAALAAARRTIVDCDRRRDHYRALLEQGTDPSVIAAWIAEVQGERLSAERVVAEHAPRRAPTALKIRAMVEELGEMTRVLASADPDDKARLYAELGLTLTYRPSDETVAVEAKPRVGVWTCRRGESRLEATPLLATSVSLVA